MESIRIKGFKSIEDSGNIEIKPITVLIGKNSCGKSNFIRVFPLIKQSVEKTIAEPFLWYGEYVDLGDYKTIKPKRNKQLATEFYMKLKLSKEMLFLFDFVEKQQTYEFVTISITIGEKYISKFLIIFKDQEISVELKDRGGIKSIEINNQIFDKTNLLTWERPSNGIIPEIESRNTRNKGLYFFRYGITNKFINEIIANLTGRTDEKGSDDADLFAKLYGLPSKDEVLSYLQNNASTKKAFEKATISDELFVKLNTYYIVGLLPKIITCINRTIQIEMDQLNYLKPIRANVQRFYRAQGINTNEVDSDGSNLPMFLYNLKDEELKEFGRWTKSNLGIKFTISNTSKNSSKLLSLILKDGSYSINLADTGYGYSQILPIIVELWILSKKRNKRQSRDSYNYTFVIEQPELHLHPAFQAKIIDLFVKIIQQAKKENIDIRIIFETHSQIMVNQLGKSIVKNHIMNTEINLLAFEKQKAVTSINQLKFNKDGMIEKWPLGFLSAED